MKRYNFIVRGMRATLRFDDGTGKDIFRNPVPNTEGMSYARGKLRPIAGGYIHGVIGWTTSVQKLID